ncbi:MAG TPA: cyclic nucleotide-binding domain-containing protein [Thermoanaerobaculia bacterium]
MTPRRSRIVFPLIVSIGLFGLYWFFSVNPLYISGFGDVRYTIFGKNLQRLLFAAFIPLIFVLVRGIDALTFDVFMSKRRQVAAPALLREIVSIVLYFVLFATALAGILHYSVTGWLATGTVLAAVLGLALQETLGNLFAGIALHLEDSFEVGDVIRTGEFIGVVEGVRWRGTRIRTFAHNSILIIPNSVLARERFEVFAQQTLAAEILSLGIDPHAAPATVIAILTQAAANVDGVVRDIPCFARVARFDMSWVTYEIKYFTRDYTQRDRIDADIRKAVWYALRRNHISLSFPISQYSVYEPPPKGETHRIPPDVLLQRLHDVDILQPLGNAAREAIAFAARVHFYSRGETILRHETAGDSMFVVHQGTVSVRVPEETPQGWREVASLGPGQVFGEMALLTGAARTADIVAATDVTAIEIAKNALQSVLQDNPELVETISAKVSERRGTLDDLRTGSKEEAHQTVLSRIRQYFGL